MRTAPVCSFCRKALFEVKRLIQGAGTAGDVGPAAVYICDECVDLCREILAESPTPPYALTCNWNGTWSWPRPAVTMARVEYDERLLAPEAGD
ncbi:MAG: hypothetical protein KJ648_07545 [Candidatus Omnitrophica bacterium]|nr:hypothetical protein [Candidatus Omnitrophota bacterium]